MQNRVNNLSMDSLGAAAAITHSWLIGIIVALLALALTVFYLTRLNRRLTRPPRPLGASSLPARLQMLSRIAATVIICIGLAVLLGWTLHVETLKRILPGRVPMNPVSAASFILCGSALLLITAGTVPGGRRALRIVGGIGSALVVLIGVLKLVAYVGGWDSFVDQMLFAESVNALDPTGPNRMAPNTAFNFILAGCALLTLNYETRRGRRPAEWLALGVGALALLALIGYAYGVKALFGVASFIPMSLHTAVAFFLLAFAILASHPQRGVMAALNSDGAGGILARRLLPACVLIPALLGYLRLLGERADLFSPELGVSIYAVAMIIFFVVLIWWTASLLHRAEADRRRTEDALVESEQRHRVIVQQAADGITLVDAETLRIMEVNDAFATLLGYTPQELAGRQIQDFIIDTPEGIAARAQKTLGAAGSVVTQRSYRRKDGSAVNVEKTANVLMLNGRRVLCTVVHDITERERAERALAEERTMLRTLIDNLPDRINVKDPQGRYVLDNIAHLRQMGLGSQDQIVGKTVHDFYPPAIADQLDRQDREVLNSRQAMIYREESILGRDGQTHWVLTTRVPIVDEQGQVTGMVGVTRDITEQKRAEQEVAEKHRLLQEALRSEHEAMEKLKTAQGALVQSEKLAGLGQMVAGVAHEINNPLSFVANNIAVLQRDVKAIAKLLEMYAKGDPILAEKNKELLKEIKDLAERVDLAYTLSNLDDMMARSRDGLKRIQQIVKDLRDFARLDEADLHEIDLNAGVASTINIIQGHAKKKRVQIDMQLEPLPLVTCYPAKLNQVIMNLVANAIDACPEAGKVTVKTSRGGGAGGAGNGAVKIEVADTGPGVPPAIRARIFDPFFTTKPLGEGTGLGLSISYGIVQDHGGTIEVGDAPTGGALFTVTLPSHRKKQT